MSDGEAVLWCSELKENELGQEKEIRCGKFQEKSIRISEIKNETI